MKYECEMIEDLLPLYKDGACSEASARAIEAHIAQCPRCADLLNELKDTTIDMMILNEKENVIESQSKFFKRKSALAGAIVAAIFAIPILICLIVNLVSGHALNWFFIVFAAMLIPTSLFVVPLMVPRNKMFMTMISFTASVILLLGVCAIYSHGSWFLVAASSVLFGLSVLFMPFIACRRPVSPYLKNFKGLTVMGVCTGTFFLMIIFIGITVRSVHYFSTAFSISVPIIALIWMIFLIIRYLPFNGFIKAGTCITIFSLFSFFGTELIVFLTNLAAEPNSVQYSSQPNLLVMIGGIVIGFVFTAIGIVYKKVKES